MSPDGQAAGTPFEAVSRIAERQRSQLLAAMIDVVGEEGWKGTTVAAVVARAGLSRRTLYELFHDKHECFLAAAEELTERVTGLIVAAYRDAATPRAGIARALRAFIAFCAHNPPTARVYLLETSVAGQQGAALWQAHLDEMTERARCALLEMRPDLPAHSGAMAVGGVYTVVRSRVLSGRAPELAGLAPEMTDALWLTLGLD